MIADHVLWCAQLDEGEVRSFGNLGSQRRLATARGTFQEHGDQRRAVAGACLRDDEVTILQDASDGLSPHDDSVGQESVQCFFAAAKGLRGKQLEEIGLVALESLLWWNHYK